jgi:hypothetical protein
MSESGMTIEGAISLGVGIEFRPSDLASTCPIRIAEQEGKLCLPDRPTASGDPAKLSPPRMNQEEITQKPLRTEWGWMFGPDSSLVMAALLRFTLSAEASVTIKAIGQRIAEEAEPWRDSLLQWIQALTKQNCGCARRPSPQQSGSNVYLWFVESGVAKPARTKGHSTGIVVGPHPAPRERITLALDKASNQIQLPVEYLLLNAAECALSELDTRRAVLDAASGAEIALRRSVDASLAEASPRTIVEYLLKRHDSLRGLVELAKVCGLQLPKDVLGRIASPRNQVAHQGRIPSWKEAIEIIQAASEVVRSLSPLE